MRTVKTGQIVRLCVCPGWSESSLGAQFLPWCANKEIRVKALSVQFTNVTRKKNWILFVIDNRLSSNFDVVKRFAWDDMSDDDKTVVCLKYSSEGQLIKWRKLNINIWLYGNVEYVGLLLFKDLVLIKFWILSNVFMKSGTPIYWS